MHSYPLVSIIIPVYNTEKYVAEAIESALNQTYKNIEIIIVDDGSTDNSYSIVKKYESEKVKVISQKNGGQCAATNKGLELANGDYIQFLDADDILDKNKIQYQLKNVLFIADKKNIAIANWGRFYGNLENVNLEKVFDFISFCSSAWVINMFKYGYMLPNSSYLTHRDLIKDAGPYNEMLSLNNDIEYFTRLMFLSKNIINVTESLVYYRSGNSKTLSQKKNLKGFQSEFLAKKLAIKYLLEKVPTEDARIASASLIFSYLYSIHDTGYKELKNETITLLKSLDYNPWQFIRPKKLALLAWLLGWEKALWLRKIIKKCYS